MKTKMQFVQRMLWLVVVAALVAAAWIAPLDAAANREVDAGLKRALLSFASARALNAVISAVQGTEIAVQPAGLGVVFTPGQVLDPVNDLVEQFSDLMLAASVSFGVQKVLLAMGAHTPVSVLLTLVAAGWAVFQLRAQPAWPWLSRLLVLLLMVRFAVPLVAIASEQVFERFLAADYAASQEAIDSTSSRLGALNPPLAEATESRGIVDRMRGWWSQNGDIKLRFAQLKAAAEHATENIVKLIVIFLLQTLVIPLLLLGLLLGFTRRAFQPAHEYARAD